MHNLVPIFILGIIVLGIYKLFELFVRRNERLAIIEKLFSLSENKEISGGSFKLPEISFGNTGNYSWALRVSLLLIGIGLGCLIAFFIQFGIYNYNTVLNNWQVEHLTGVIYLSLIAIFGGAGLLIAYLIESKQAKNK
jgi:hypothetical protein